MAFCGLECLGTIGTGAFGSVHLVQNADNDQFAVKVMQMRKASPKDREVARNEVHVLQQLKHDNVIIYVGSLSHEGLLYLITEVCTGGDLEGFLEQLVRPVPEDLLFTWLWQMACGLEYMHTFGSTPILHRDLKPSNIYLTETGDIRLGDMGIARILEAPDALAETFCGTPSYMSPEVLFEIPYDEKTDIWSLGCCVVRMLTLEVAYRGTSLDVLRHAVVRGPPPVPQGCNKDLRRLVSSMLRIKCEERPSATDILDGDVLQDYKDMEPYDLLQRHKLLAKLGMHLTHPSSSPLSRESPTLNLNEGQSLREYHEKRQTRMRGRRQDETMKSSGGVDTSVLHTEQRRNSKTQKKTLVTDRDQDQDRTLAPAREGVSASGKSDSGGGAGVDRGGGGCGGAAAAEKGARDVSLSRRLVTSFTSSLSSVRSQRPGPQMPNVCAQALDPEVLAEASPIEQMIALKSMLITMLGEDVWNEACFLIMTVSSPADLQAQLASLLGDLSQLSQMVIYCYVAESIRQTGT